MMPSASVTPRFWQAANARSAWSYTTGMFEQRLAAEERERQALRLQLVEPLLDPRRQPGAVVERHLVGVLVVIAVIALEAVIAGEVALQRRQHRHAHLLGVFAVVGEELVQGFRVGRAAGHDEAMLGQCRRAPRARRCPAARARARPDRPTHDRAAPAMSSETISCASVRVFIRNTSPRSGERDTKVEHRLLHMFETFVGKRGITRQAGFGGRVQTRSLNPSALYRATRRSSLRFTQIELA